MWAIPEMRGSCLLCGYNRRLSKPNTRNCEHTAAPLNCIIVSVWPHTHIFSFPKHMWCKDDANSGKTKKDLDIGNTEGLRLVWGSAVNRQKSKVAVGALDFLACEEKIMKKSFTLMEAFDGSLLANLSVMNVFNSDSNNPLQLFTFGLRPSSLLFAQHFRVKAGEVALVNSNIRLQLFQKHLLCQFRVVRLGIYACTHTGRHTCTLRDM